MKKPIIYHIPVCPFSQRIEILLRLKGLDREIDFHVVDITKPRPDWLLEKSDGTTAMPIMELEDGRVLKESLVIMRYVEERWAEPQIARRDPYERAIERLFISGQGRFANAGYGMVMNRDRARTGEMRDELLSCYSWMNHLLLKHNPGGTWLFDRFGLPELVYTTLMMRFWFLDYYEDFQLPAGSDFERVARWRHACLTHPDTQQVSYDEIVKLYYDYAVGAGNGALPEGRSVSSFTFEPDWPDRPMPPRDKYDRIASDGELGLVS